MPAYPTRHPVAHNSILGALFSQFVPLKKWQKKVDTEYKKNTQNTKRKLTQNTRTERSRGGEITLGVAG